MVARAESVAAGEARCPAPSVQEVVRADGDGEKLPASYRIESYKWRSDADIPFERYTSPEFFKREIDRMWPRTWQWACREEHIPEAGDYYVYDIGPYSWLIVRTASGDIRAYQNACLHRGTKLKPSFTDGWTPKLACPFHGWTWDLDGKLAELPCAWDFPHVAREKFNLPEARVGVWAGFVFINMDEHAMPLEEYLAPLPAHAAHAELQDRYVALHVQKELPCNWKVASEAFVESYHTPSRIRNCKKGPVTSTRNTTRSATTSIACSVSPAWRAPLRAVTFRSRRSSTPWCWAIRRAVVHASPRAAMRVRPWPIISRAC